MTLNLYLYYFWLGWRGGKKGSAPSIKGTVPHLGKKHFLTFILRIRFEDQCREVSQRCQDTSEWNCVFCFLTSCMTDYRITTREFSHFLLTSMQMKGSVKFCCPLNISRALQQNSVEALNDWSGWCVSSLLLKQLQGRFQVKQSFQSAFFFYLANSSPSNLAV